MHNNIYAESVRDNYNVSYALKISEKCLSMWT